MSGTVERWKQIFPNLWVRSGETDEVYQALADSGIDPDHFLATQAAHQARTSGAYGVAPHSCMYIVNNAPGVVPRWRISMCVPPDDDAVEIDLS